LMVSLRWLRGMGFKLTSHWMVIDMKLCILITVFFSLQSVFAFNYQQDAKRYKKKLKPGHIQSLIQQKTIILKQLKIG